MRLLVLLLIGLMTFSCHYPDGPITSLRFKKDRLSRTWRFKTVQINNLDITEQFDGRVIQLTQDNSISGHTITEGVLNVDSVYSTSGRWEFGENSTLILDFFYIDSTSGSYSKESWEIRKLTTKELWLYAKGDRVIQYFLESEQE